MFSERLKEQTKINHQALEGVLVPQIKGIRTREDYLRILSLFYSYFGALEEKISRHIDRGVLPDYGERRKTGSLANDISSLGGKPSPFVPDEQLPEISDIVQALAALYVIEGSALGGKIISKMISQGLGGQADHALTFYNGYGEHTMDMWATFKEAMNRRIVSERDQSRAIVTANETFLKFRDLGER